MKRWIPLVLLSLSVSAHAAPGQSAFDDMDSLLVEKGLVQRLGSQIQQAGNRVGDAASELVMNAMGFLGVPYKFGGNSADAGFDCSGFVRAVFEESVGKVLPRRSDQQAAATQPIERSELKPGDLVFFNTMRRAFSHVGIYVGDGKFIHSPRSGGKVRVEDMQESYWQKRFNGARRVAPEAQAGNAQAAGLQAAAAEIQATPTPR